MDESGHDGQNERRGESNMLYTLTDKVSLPLCLLLGFQHFLVALISTAALPLLLIEPLCMTGDKDAVTHLIGANFFAAGMATLLQTIFGVRLPIVQGTSFAYLVPTLSILSQPQWMCPGTVSTNGTKDAIFFMLTDGNDSKIIQSGTEEHRTVWLSRIREVNGAIMVASVLQVTLGFSGVLGLLLRYVGPLSIAPTITIIGLGLVDAAAAKASQQWWIAFLTAALVVVFSQCLDKVSIPIFCCRRQKPSDSQHVQRDRQQRRCQASGYRVPIFTLFPVLLGVMVTWLISYLLTVTNVFPAGHSARTDISSDVLTEAAWFHVPYPGRQGTPTVSTGAVLGIMSAVLASVVESVGDYYACAQLACAPPPPPHAINRGIVTEGIASILGASLGAANGSTSYSQSIAAVGVTRVASRPVIIVAGVLLMVCGCVGKVSALFLTVTEPILGGLFIVLFGMITAVGLSQLGGVDLSRGRNQLVVGLSLFLGLCLPRWVSLHRDAIDTGNKVADEVLGVLLSTGMFVGGATGFVLDNLLPGTAEERGMKQYKRPRIKVKGKSAEVKAEQDVYGGIPLLSVLTRRCLVLGRLPFCPPSRDSDPLLMAETVNTDV